MSVHTKTRRIRHPIKTKAKPKTRKKESPLSWREVFKEELKKHGEGGLMLRGSRHKANLTQEALANEIGISQNHISEMENGKRTIGKLMALRFAKFFKTDYRKFL